MEAESDHAPTPNLEVGSGISADETGYAAGENAARSAAAPLRHHAVSAVLVYASVRHPLGEVLRGVKSVFPSAAIMGCTTAGEVHNGLHRHKVAVVALASPYLEVRAAVGCKVSRDWRAAVNQALDSETLSPFLDAAPDARRRRLREGKRLFAILFSPGNTKHATSHSFEILNAVRSKTLGAIPIFAGSSADDWQLQTTAVLFGDQVYEDGLLLAVFETSLNFGLSLGHGFTPTATRMHVSAADGHEITRLDKRPAAEVIAEKLSVSSGDLTGKHITLSTRHTFGMPRLMGQFAVNIATFQTDRRGVRMAQPLEPGDELVLMESASASAVACAGETLRKALLRADTSRADIILCHYCALRPRLMGEALSGEEIAQLMNMAGSTPVAGFSSFGEGGQSDDGPSIHNNASVSVLAISGELSPLAHAARENERLQAEVARYASELEQRVEQRTFELSNVLEGTNAGSWDWDVSNDKLRINARTAELLGSTPEQLGSINQAFWRQRIHPDDRTECESQMRAVLDGRADYFNAEYRLEQDVGQWIWINSRGKVVERNDAGEPLRASGTHQEISQRKKVELERQEAKEAAETARNMLQLVLDAIPTRVFWKDLDLNYLGCNKLFAADAGYRDPDQLIGLNDYDMGWRNEAELYRADDARVMADGRALIGYEEPQTTPQGETIWIRTSKIPLRDTHDGRIFGILGAYEDITERKKAEEKIRIAQEKAEQAARIKSAFLANMSHEIRTPLNVITGMAYLVRRGGLTDDQADRMDKLEAAGAHLLETINAILDLSKIEAGKFVLDEARVRPERLIDDVLGMIQERARAKHLQLSSALAPLPAGLLGDATRLRQALLNYAANAVKFTDVGAITLRAGLVSEDGQSALLRFEVEDTGIGIPEQTIPRLFGAFEQADNSMTRQYGGSGLGLAITRKIAELMDGEAGVRSRPGRGSTFWFTARLKKSAAASARADAAGEDADPEQSLRRRYRGRRILLAEDEPINREIAQSMLEDAGLAVDAVEDGAAALRMAQSQAYDLILMDMQMPRMDGLQASRAIRALPQYRKTPILAATANAFAEDEARCRDAGMNDFIAKPMKPQILFTAVLRWLDEETAG